VADAQRYASLANLARRAEEAGSQDHLELSRIYADIGRFSDALREARAAVAAAPDRSDVRHRLISTLCEQDKLDEAAQAFREAEKHLRPEDTSGLRNALATAYCRLDRHAEAVEHLEAVLDSNWKRLTAPPPPAAAFGGRPGGFGRPGGGSGFGGTMGFNAFDSALSPLLAALFSRANTEPLLPLVDKYLTLASDLAKTRPECSSVAKRLLDAKLRMLIKASRRAEAVALADERLKPARAGFAADPNNVVNAEALLAALSTMVTATMPVELGTPDATALAAAAEWYGFLDREFEKFRTSAAFIQASAEGLMQANRVLGPQGRQDELERLRKQWQDRLSNVQPSDAAGRQALAGVLSYFKSQDSYAEVVKRREDRIGKKYVPIEPATWLNGSPLAPSDLEGKVLLTYFGGVWGGETNLPYFKKLQEQYGDRGLVVVMVAERDGYLWNAETKRCVSIRGLPAEVEDASTAAFAEYHGLPFRIAAVADRSLMQEYGLGTATSYSPHSFVVVDRQGLMRRIGTNFGPGNFAELEETIRQTLQSPAAEARK
jgi:tetratricopeptide (TPR) repeat protein